MRFSCPFQSYTTKIQIKLNSQKRTPAQIEKNNAASTALDRNISENEKKYRNRTRLFILLRGKSEQWRENCASLSRSNLSNGNRKMASAEAQQHGGFRLRLIKNASHLMFALRPEQTCAPRTFSINRPKYFQAIVVAIK